MIYVALIMAMIVGSLNYNTIHFWLSRLAGLLRRNGSIQGTWAVTYLNDDSVVEESFTLFGEFGNVSYGMLTARLQNGSTAKYRARLEHYFGNNYAISLEPGSGMKNDLGSGILHLDTQQQIANGKIVGLSIDRMNAGETGYVREFSATKQS